ncbi:hypothetical protein [Moraxella cuniculi]|nr:hypothetical protein [Moraxella cuniculi]
MTNHTQTTANHLPKPCHLHAKGRIYHACPVRHQLPLPNTTTPYGID